MSLSDFAIRAAKPHAKSHKLSDGAGLYVAIQPSGSKLWRLKYRYAGKEKLLSIGPYPLVGLAEAREKRDAAKKLLLNGVDPSAKRKLEKIAAETAARTTFALIAEELIQRMRDRDAAEATISKTEWLLLDLASPIASRPIREITSAEILSILRKIEQTGRRESGRRLRGAIGSVFRYAIVTLRADADPTLALRGSILPPQVVGRAAITDEAAFGALLRAIDDYDGWPTVTAALKLLALTCVRPGEVRVATRSEFDLETAMWRIPAGRMKMREPHDVPLSPQALAVLHHVWPFSDGGSYVFPSIRSKQRPVSDGTLNAALRRMGYRKDQVTAHGFRVSASSILNERGFDPDVIEAILAHKDPNGIRRAYNRARYWEQRQQLMQDWADILDELRSPAQRPSAS